MEQLRIYRDDRTMMPPFVDGAKAPSSLGCSSRGGDDSKGRVPNRTPFVATEWKQMNNETIIPTGLPLNQQAPALIPTPPFNHEMISGTIDNIAEGIIDFTKTASAAFITSLHRHFEQGHDNMSDVGARPAHPAALEHPLQREKVTMIPSSANHTSLKELALTLEQSVAILFKHFNEPASKRRSFILEDEEEERREEDEMEDEATTILKEKSRKGRITETANSISNGQSLPSSTNADILDALSKIDLVRTELLKQHYSSVNSSSP